MSNMFDYMNDDELTPYKGSKKYKKCKKAVKKSSHKHIYLPCIVESIYSSDNRLHYGLGKYCSVCGKVVQTTFFVTVKEPDKPFSRMLFRLDEIQALYPDYPVIPNDPENI